MRVEPRREGDLIIKDLKASSYLGGLIKERIADYQMWLTEAGIHSPPTEITVGGDKVIFKQPFVDGSSDIQPDGLIGAFKKLHFEEFGIDSNPRNFLNAGDPIMVDFSPFLIRNDRALAEQFDYSLDTVYVRYFTIENVLVFYIVRLFREGLKDSFVKLQSSVNFLLERFDTILPREKLRLLRALQMHERGEISKFPDFYESSKNLAAIPRQDALKLRQKLVDLSFWREVAP